MSVLPGAAGITARAMLGHARLAAGLAGAAAPQHVVGLVVLAVATGLAPITSTWLTRSVLDGLVTGIAPGHLYWLASALALAGIATAVLPRISQYSEAEMNRRVRAIAVDRLFTALSRRLIGLAALENPRMHDRIRLAQQAGNTGPGDLVNNGIGMGKNLLTLSGFLVTLLLINPWLVLAVAVTTVPTVRAEALLSRQRADAMWRIGHAERRQYFYSTLLSSPREAKEVRLFGLGAFFRDRMLSELRTANVANKALDRRELVTQSLLALTGGLVAGGGLVWAVVAARAQQITIGDVTVFINAVAGMQSAASGMVAQFAAAHQALLLLDHYNVATTLEPDLRVPEEPVQVPPLSTGIDFEDVWFRYGPDRPWVLRGVTLTIPAGQSLALVGLNGAGKTTIVKLLCRLYDPTYGHIRWDGVDIREVDPAKLRDCIGTVFQDYVEYELSATENIGLGDLPLMDDRCRIEEAAERAGIHDALAALPRGYDTMLTRMFIEGVDDDNPEAGVLLSGGQGQRLALARAFLRDDRDLLILDEPSAGLDAEAEAEVHSQLRHHRSGRASLLISHRLNTIRDADIIVVIEDGWIAESGTHEDLVARGGTYARLFRLQANGYVDLMA